jgi:hypothetical protein
MRNLCAATVLLAWSSSMGHAQTIQRYDQHGIPQGFEKRTGDRIQDYDRTGTPRGWSVQKGDVVQNYDQSGRPTDSYKIKK